MSSEQPGEGGWVVRKSDGIELKFPSLESLKEYIISGVVGPGDIVAPEHEGWAKMEDLAEIAALVGRHHTNDPADTRPAPKTRSGLRRKAKTIPPPLPIRAADVLDVQDITDVVEALHEEDSELPESKSATPVDVIIDPKPETQSGAASEPVEPEVESSSDTFSLDGSGDDPVEELVSRPIRGRVDDAVDAGAMILALKRRQRVRNIAFSVVIGLLLGVVAFVFQREAPRPSAQANAVSAEARGEPPATPTVLKVEGPEPVKPSTQKPDSTTTTQVLKPTPKETMATIALASDAAASQADRQDTADNPSPPDEPQKNTPKTAAETSKPTTSHTPKTLAKKADSGSTSQAKVTDKPNTKSPASKERRTAQKAPSKLDPSTRGPDPRTVDGLLRRAKKLRGTEPAEALRLYKKVLALNPSHVDAMHMAGRALLRLGRTSEAVAMLKRCRTSSPRFSPCIFFLGQAYDRAGQAELARKAYQTLVDRNPESSYALKARKKLGQ